MRGPSTRLKDRDVEYSVRFLSALSDEDARLVRVKIKGCKIPPEKPINAMERRSADRLGEEKYPIDDITLMTKPTSIARGIELAWTEAEYRYVITKVATEKIDSVRPTSVRDALNVSLA